MRASTRPAVLHGSWIGALTCWYVVTLARFGFHPTDQGWTLATSRRLLQDEVPHQDIVSARPLGYALLHTVDFALPGPLFLASLVVATAELIVATVVLALLLTDRPLRRWGPLLTAAVAAAALVNFHTFPSTAWYTIDGIFVTACGWRCSTSASCRGGRPCGASGSSCWGSPS